MAGGLVGVINSDGSKLKIGGQATLLLGTGEPPVIESRKPESSAPLLPRLRESPSMFGLTWKDIETSLRLFPGTQVFLLEFC